MRTSLEHCSNLAQNLLIGCRNLSKSSRSYKKNSEKLEKSLSNMDKNLCMSAEVFALIKRMRSGLVGNP